MGRGCPRPSFEARQGSEVEVGQGKAWLGRAGQGKHGSARQGGAGRGGARLGVVAWLGWAGLGRAGQGRAWIQEVRDEDETEDEAVGDKGD